MTVQKSTSLRWLFISLLACLALSLLASYLYRSGAPSLENREVPEKEFNVKTAAKDLDQLRNPIALHGPSAKSKPLVKRSKVVLQVLDLESNNPLDSSIRFSNDKEESDRSTQNQLQTFDSSKGIFDLELENGSYTIEISSQGFLPRRESLVVDSSKSEFLFSLIRYNTVPTRIKLLDKTSGMSISEANIDLSYGDPYGDGRRSISYAPSDYDHQTASFVFSELPVSIEGIYWLSINAKGYVEYSESLSPDQVGTLVVLPMSRSGSIGGTLYTHEGLPAQGTVDLSALNFPYSRVQTDENGEFAFTGIPIGNVALIGSSRDGLSDQQFTRTGDHNVKIFLKRGFALRGRVIGLTEDDEKNASLIAQGAGSRAVSQAKIDQDGYFEFTNLPEGQVSLIVSMFRRGGRFEDKKLTRIIKVGPNTTQDVTLKFGKRNTVTGKVTVNGEVYRGFIDASPDRELPESSLLSIKTVTDGSGLFIFDGLDNGWHTVTVAEKHKQRIYVSGDAEFNIRLSESKISNP